MTAILYICDTRIDPELLALAEEGAETVVKPKKRGVAKDTRTDKKSAGKSSTATLARVNRGKAKPSATKRTKAKSAKATTATPPDFRVRELDPQRKCGAGTSVERLYRVDEWKEDGAVRLHLVFLDRHGWYCEHGRNCPAVPHARKLGDRARQPGPTHNGRMRA